MRFPQALYRAGGTETSDTCEGRGFTSRLVNDADELEAALADGWHETVPAMVEAAKAAEALTKLAESGAAPGDAKDQKTDTGAGGGQPPPAAPTRAELEAKATELGVEFSAKLGDKKLAERIAAKLAESGA